MIRVVRVSGLVSVGFLYIAGIVTLGFGYGVPPASSLASATTAVLALVFMRAPSTHVTDSLARLERFGLGVFAVALLLLPIAAVTR